jgi:hypothetical protein
MCEGLLSGITGTLALRSEWSRIACVAPVAVAGAAMSGDGAWGLAEAAAEAERRGESEGKLLCL